MTTLDQIIDDFAFLDEWEDRYRYVIELGKALPEMPDAKRTSENKVQGCASQVWLATQATGDPEDPVLLFEGESDAHIVRGLVAIVLDDLFRQARLRDLQAGCHRYFQQDRPDRTSVDATGERPALDDPADQERSRDPPRRLRSRPSPCIHTIAELARM